MSTREIARSGRGAHVVLMRRLIGWEVRVYPRNRFTGISRDRYWRHRSLSLRNATRTYRRNVRYFCPDSGRQQ